MQMLRVALAFGRADVDRFIGEVDHDQFMEWCDFLWIEPVGWQATRVQTARLGFLTAQAHSSKRLKERDYDIRLGANIQSPETDKARWEAMSIRQGIGSKGD